jgi:hypothetical protein
MMLPNMLNKIRPGVYLIIICALSGTCSVTAQSLTADASVILENLFVRMLNSNDDNVRSGTNDSIKLIVDSYVRSDSVFTHKFTSLRYLGQIESADSKIKIITWNLVLRKGTNKYFCYLIRKGNKKESNVVYELTSEYSGDPVRQDILYSQDNWYGALYYQIIPFRIHRSDYYALLGLSYANTQMSRKIIEIMSFSPDGKIIFGKDCLIKEKTTMQREVFEYSAEGVMTLRKYSPKMIVFDHLDAYSSGDENSSESYGPGLSFDGYMFKRGAWHFTQNVDVKNKKNRP